MMLAIFSATEISHQINYLVSHLLTVTHIKGLWCMVYSRRGDGWAKWQPILPVQPCTKPLIYPVLLVGRCSAVREIGVCLSKRIAAAL